MTPEKMAELTDSVARNHDKTAYALLFNYFAPRINGYYRKIQPDPELAEELTQEVLIVLWQKPHLFDSQKSSLSTWLYRVARNRWIDYLRQKKNIKLDPHEPALLPSEEIQPDDYCDIKVRDRRIRQELQKLPREQMEIIKLAFFHENSHSAITEITGLPIGTVKSRIRLAFKKLKKALEECEYAEAS